MRIRKSHLKLIYKLKDRPALTVSNFENVHQAQIGDYNYTTLNDAISSGKYNEKTLIKLLSNVYLYNSNINIVQGKNIVLDLNGYSIVSCNKDGTIYLEGDLTLIDTSINQSGLIENTYSNGMGIYFYKSGSLTMFGGTIKGFCALYSWNDFFNPKVEIHGGTIYGRYFGVSFRNVNDMIIKNGTIMGGVTAFNVWS